jgi:predicted  nucleic acid-binding Zn-ribbon protein
MTNRNDEYESFLDAWQEVIGVVENISIANTDNETVDSTQDFARLIKVITYIDEAIKSIDSELVPLTLWSECKNHCISCKPSVEEAVNTRTEANILTANNQVDILISKLAPYFQDSLVKIKALKPAFNAYIKYIANQLDAYKKKNDDLMKELEEKLTTSSDINNELHGYKENLSKLYSEIVVGTDEETSLQEKLRGLEQTIDEQHSKIDSFYSSLLVDEGSIKSKIEEAQELIITTNLETQQISDDLSEKLSELKDFHKKIFGEPNAEGDVENGLKFEINERKNNLDSLITTQTNQYQAIKANIESLLPGATSAGLASAYHDLSVSFVKPITIYTRLFFLSIVVLLGLALYFTNQNAILTDVPTATSDITIFKDIGIFLLQRLPIVLPVIWLAIFASKRRSEAERLKQEYAHKEALAKSYQSFKLQIEELDGENKEPLLEKLLAVAIDTIATNASSTLDKKHGDNTPLIGVFDKTIDRLPFTSSKE